MEERITTYGTLWALVDLDEKESPQREMATLLLDAMRDWPTLNQNSIAQFLEELHDYFGSPLTQDKINRKYVDTSNLWEMESGASISDLIKLSAKHFNEVDINWIVKHILDYYDPEFRKTDFIAELTFLSTDQGGRLGAATSGYRPQIKFEFDEMLTSGQQTYIGQELVFPGETVEAKIKIVSAPYFAGRLREDMSFEFKEGDKLIGTGVIKYLVNDELAERKG